MPHEISFVDAGGTHALAHYNMIAAIRDLCVAAGWTVLRYVDDQEQHELIMSAPGLANDAEILCGVRSYHSVAGDYYNLAFAVMTGYVPSSSFDAQPGIRLSGCPAHNQRIDYWLTVNGQRLALAMKVGTPVYTSAYIGKFFPYATPGQYPYPVCVAAMLNGAAPIRFSSTDTNYRLGYKADSASGVASLAVRTPGGAWVQARTWPYSNRYLYNGTEGFGSGNFPRPSGTSYKLQPVTLWTNDGLWGELDGIHAITGFDNAVENTLDVDGVHYVVIQEKGNTGFTDYYALQLDPNEE